MILKDEIVMLLMVVTTWKSKHHTSSPKLASILTGNNALVICMPQTLMKDSRTFLECCLSLQVEGRTSGAEVLVPSLFSTGVDSQAPKEVAMRVRGSIQRDNPGIFSRKINGRTLAFLFKHRL